MLASALVADKPIEAIRRGRLAAVRPEAARHPKYMVGTGRLPAPAMGLRHKAAATMPAGFS